MFEFKGSKLQSICCIVSTGEQSGQGVVMYSGGPIDSACACACVVSYLKLGV